MDPNIERIETLAHTQMGRFTRSQVAELDHRGRQLVHSQIRSLKWRRETTRVLSLPGAPRNQMARLWTGALHLAPTAVVSHFSAARVHGLPVDDGMTDSLILPNGSNRALDGFVLYQRSDLAPGDSESVDRLPVTSLPRTLYDLGSMVSMPRLEAWMDELTMDRRVSPSRVAATVERLSRPGKKSVPALLEVLAARLPGAGVEQGPLELALKQIATLAGLPTGSAQFPHPSQSAGGEFVDRAWPEARLIAEADGRCWHDRISASGNDARRDRAAAEEGWLTVRFRHEDLVRNPVGAASQLRRIFAARSADNSRTALDH